MSIVLGIDPGLQHLGWGVVDGYGRDPVFVGCGTFSPATRQPLEIRLAAVQEAVTGLITQHQPDHVAVEETFVNNNAASALKLGMARGVILAAIAAQERTVTSYAPNLVKKSLTGSGHADKNQMITMIRTLLPACTDHLTTPDSADALAIALCHLHHMQTRARIEGL